MKTKQYNLEMRIKMNRLNKESGDNWKNLSKSMTELNKSNDSIKSEELMKLFAKAILDFSTKRFSMLFSVDKNFPSACNLSFVNQGIQFVHADSHFYAAFSR